ncbi:thioredoxin domain-containing protein [Homoserinimonas sp. OAct 916]|uniref:DsbA family protein n=1 Tax=Homoserinimonas sp. OAct 916 TaxID=2211450 RepID=UPI000DBE78E9|nr:thioredoxin domain-containing protein [Homoserinimonas sp. OAct 916]
MTISGSADNRPTKNERREAAREKARELREAQKKRERRNKILVQGGVVIGIIAIVAVVALILVNTLKPAGPGPKNMASDGIVIGEGLVAQTTPALAMGDAPIPTTPNTTGDVVQIRVYLDYLCPACGMFEATNNAQIREWLNSGAATLEVHPLAMLVNQSSGTKYSLRATNAAACVANYSPNQFFDFNELMFKSQPKEGSTGLTDEEIQKITADSKVENQSAINSCIVDQQFKPWANAATDRALGQPIPNSNVDELKGTPTVVVNGKYYQGSIQDPKEFAQFIQEAAGAAYESSTPSEAPSDAPSPSPSPAG